MSKTVEAIAERITIARPIAHVWPVMTEETPQWLGCLRYKKELGAIFFMQQDRAKAARDDVSNATQCEILALDAPHLFKFSWFVPGMPPTFVSFHLEAADAETTLVRFTHEGWDQFPPDAIRLIRDALGNGWKTYVLPSLKHASER